MVGLPAAGLAVTNGVAAAINVGGSGLIMSGGGVVAITAITGDVSADIWVGGAAAVTTITGNNITGDIAVGTMAGSTGLVLNDREDANDAAPLTYTITPGAISAIEIAAGNVTATSATIDRITVFADSGCIDRVV